MKRSRRDVIHEVVFNFVGKSVGNSDGDIVGDSDCDFVGVSDSDCDFVGVSDSDCDFVGDFGRNMYDALSLGVRNVVAGSLVIRSIAPSRTGATRIP